jgi:hypothetical protein
MSSNLEGIIRSQDDMVTMLYELTTPAVHSTFGAMYKAFQDAYDNEEDIDRDLKHSMSRVSKWTNHDVRGVAAAYESVMEDECLRLTYSIVRCSAYIKHATGIITTADVEFQTSFPDVLHCILIYASRALTVGNNVACLKDESALEETTTILREKRVVENALTSLSKKCIMSVMHKNGESASQQQRTRNEELKELDKIRKAARREEEERVEAEERAKIRARAKARERAEAQAAEEAEAIFQEAQRARAQRAQERAEALARADEEEKKWRDEQLDKERRVLEEARAEAVQEAELAREQAEEELRAWKEQAERLRAEEEARLQAEQQAEKQAEQKAEQQAEQQAQEAVAVAKQEEEAEVRRVTVSSTPTPKIEAQDASVPPPPSPQRNESDRRVVIPSHHDDPEVTEGVDVDDDVHSSTPSTDNEETADNGNDALTELEQIRIRMENL